MIVGITSLFVCKELPLKSFESSRDQNPPQKVCCCQLGAGRVGDLHTNKRLIMMITIVMMMMVIISMGGWGISNGDSP